MEERRGESIEETMKKAGPQFYSQDEARAAAASIAKRCDEMGIDPTLTLSERVARLQDIHQGSPLMAEERKRKAQFEVGDQPTVVDKQLPPTIADLQKKPKTFGDIYGMAKDGWP